MPSKFKFFLQLKKGFYRKYAIRPVCNVNVYIHTYFRHAKVGRSDVKIGTTVQDSRSPSLVCSAVVH
jgi:hypothetical protein